MCKERVHCPLYEKHCPVVSQCHFEVTGSVVTCALQRLNAAGAACEVLVVDVASDLYTRSVSVGFPADKQIDKWCYPLAAISNKPIASAKCTRGSATRTVIATTCSYVDMARAVKQKKEA